MPSVRRGLGAKHGGFKGGCKISHRGWWYHYARTTRESHVLVTRSHGLHASFDGIKQCCHLPW
jgi:hypothetical protein